MGRFIRRRGKNLSRFCTFGERASVRAHRTSERARKRAIENRELLRDFATIIAILIAGIGLAGGVVWTVANDIHQMEQRIEYLEFNPPTPKDFAP